MWHTVGEWCAAFNEMTVIKIQKEGRDCMNLKDSELLATFKRLRTIKRQKEQHVFMQDYAKRHGWDLYVDGIPEISPLQPENEFQLAVLVPSFKSNTDMSQIARTIEYGIKLIPNLEQRSEFFKSDESHTEILPDLFDTHQDGFYWELIDFCVNIGLSPLECWEHAYYEPDVQAEAGKIVRHLSHRSIFPAINAYPELIDFMAQDIMPTPYCSGYRTTNGDDILSNTRKDISPVKPSAGFHVPYIEVNKKGKIIIDITVCTTKISRFSNPVTSVIAI